MTLFDKILLGAIILSMPPLLFLMCRVVREDLVRWFGGWRNRRFWAVMERLQPDENIALLRRRRKRDYDKRRE